MQPPSTTQTCLLALDWGTSSLRAHRMAAGGAVLETRVLDHGVARVGAEPDRAGEPAAAFEHVFDEACGDWVRACPATPVIACGRSF